jgi:hypothetical protein
LARNLFSARKALLLYLVSSILIKAICESQWIGRYSETDSSDGQRDQLDPSVREANAEVQSGSYCVRFECPDDIDRLVVHRGVDFLKVTWFSRSPAIKADLEVVEVICDRAVQVAPL